MSLESTVCYIRHTCYDYLRTYFIIIKEWLNLNKPSFFEINVNNTLKSLNLNYKWNSQLPEQEKFIAPLSGEWGTFKYEPDFIVTLPNRNSKIKLIVEPHGVKWFDEKFIKKLTAFKNSEYHNTYRTLTMIEKIPKSKARLLKPLHIRGYSDVSDFFFIEPEYKPKINRGGFFSTVYLPDSDSMINLNKLNFRNRNISKAIVEAISKIK